MGYITTDIPLLTRIRPQYAEFLATESMHKKVTKKTIIDEMFRLYIAQKEKNTLEDAYLRMSHDTEYLSECENNAKEYLSHS